MFYRLIPLYSCFTSLFYLLVAINTFQLTSLHPTMLCFIYVPSCWFVAFRIFYSFFGSSGCTLTCFVSAIFSLCFTIFCDSSELFCVSSSSSYLELFSKATFFTPSLHFFLFVFSQAPDCVDSMHSSSEPTVFRWGIWGTGGGGGVTGTNLLLFPKRMQREWSRAQLWK